MYDFFRITISYEHNFCLNLMEIQNFKIIITDKFNIYIMIITKAANLESISLIILL